MAESPLSHGCLRYGEKYLHFSERAEKSQKGDTVKINYDSSFPLYQEDGRYKIMDLYEFYYERAQRTAEKFDRRNGTDYYRKKLEESLHEDV